MRYRVLIEQDEDGVYVAEVPALPGCISQGKTRSDVIDNIKGSYRRVFGEPASSWRAGSTVHNRRGCGGYSVSALTCSAPSFHRCRPTTGDGTRTG
jgi:hypothetical protein